VIEKDGGEKLYKTEVVAMNLIFLDKKWDPIEGAHWDEAPTPMSASIDDDDLF
jgi:hypothetical protein